MKLSFVLLSLAIFLPASTFAAGSEAIIKQRAKELRDQNNVRQGVPPPAPAPQPAKPNAAQPTALTPMAKLQADLAAIKPNSQVTAEQKQQLNRDLLALALGPKKPSPGATSKLAGDMAAALAQKALSEGTRSRLLQDLNGVFNPANIPASQMQDIVSDVQAVFQASGVARKDAVTIADDVKAIAAELQKPAK
jgi:hypothetical protein